MFNDKLKKDIENIENLESMNEDDRKSSIEKTYLDDINNAIMRGEFYDSSSKTDKEKINYSDWVKADIHVLNNTKEKDYEEVTKRIFKNANESPDYFIKLVEEHEEEYHSLVEDEKTEFSNSFSADAINEELRNKIPENVKSKYIYDEKSRAYYLKGLDTPSIKDNGRGKLASKNSHRETAKDIVAIAESRGWSKVKLTGTTPFRRSAWLEASLKGIESEGYKPSTKDLAELKMLQEKARENTIEEIKEENPDIELEDVENEEPKSEEEENKEKELENKKPEQAPEEKAITEDFELNKRGDSFENIEEYVKSKGEDEHNEFKRHLEREFKYDENLSAQENYNNLSVAANEYQGIDPQIYDFDMPDTEKRSELLNDLIPKKEVEQKSLKNEQENLAEGEFISKSTNKEAEDFKSMSSKEFLEKYPNRMGTVQRKELAKESIENDDRIPDSEKANALKMLDDKIINDIEKGVYHEPIEHIKIEEHHETQEEEEIEK